MCIEKTGLGANKVNKKIHVKEGNTDSSQTCNSAYNRFSYIKLLLTCNTYFIVEKSHS